MTWKLFLLTALWLAIAVAAGLVQNVDRRQSRELAVVAFGTSNVRGADSDSPNDKSPRAVAVVPVVASFIPIISYGTVLFVLAYIAGKLRAWLGLRARGPHYLEEEDDANVELLPTSVADIRPEFRDFPVLPPLVPSPSRPASRIGRPGELENIKFNRIHGRSSSLGLPSPVLTEHAPSLPLHVRSTPNTPSPLIDLSIPDGIHARKPFVRELASDLNVSPDTLFGVQQSVSGHGEDIADLYLKMKATTLESPESSPLSNRSSEQDITLVQTDVDLIDFSPRQRALKLETSILGLEGGFVESPVEQEGDVASTRSLAYWEGQKPLDGEVPLLDFSRWDDGEADWGFAVVSPSVAPEPLSPITPVHDNGLHMKSDVGQPLRHSHTGDSTTVDLSQDDPFASPTTPLSALPTDQDGYSLRRENAAVNPFASPVVSPIQLESDDRAGDETLVQLLDDSALTSSESSVVSSDEDVPMEIHSFKSYQPDAPSDLGLSNPESVHVSLESPLSPHVGTAPSAVSVSLNVYGGSHEDLMSIADEADARSPSTSLPSSPLVEAQLELPGTPLGVLDNMPLSIDTAALKTTYNSQPASSMTIPDHSALPSPVDDDPAYIPLDDSRNNGNTHELNDFLLDDPKHATSPATAVEAPDPDFLPLPAVSVSSQQRDLSDPAQTPTPPDSPLLAPSKKAKPAWSVRAAGAPPLGLSASGSSADTSISSPSESSKDNENIKNTSSTLSEPPSPATSPVDLSTALPGSFPAAEPVAVESEEKERAVEKTQPVPRARAMRSPIDIALAMQLRPGLGIGADPAWMVRFLMSMFGWMVVLISGTGGSEGYRFPAGR